METELLKIGGSHIISMFDFNSEGDDANGKTDAVAEWIWKHQ